MYIDKIEPAGRTRFITVTMSADEANDIANGLYHASEINNVVNNPRPMRSLDGACKSNFAGTI